MLLFGGVGWIPEFAEGMRQEAAGEDGAGQDLTFRPAASAAIDPLSCFGGSATVPDFGEGLFAQVTNFFCIELANGYAAIRQQSEVTSQCDAAWLSNCPPSSLQSTVQSQPVIAFGERSPRSGVERVPDLFFDKFQYWSGSQSGVQRIAVRGDQVGGFCADSFQAVHGGFGVGDDGVNFSAQLLHVLLQCGMIFERLHCSDRVIDADRQSSSSQWLESTNTFFD